MPRPFEPIARLGWEQEDGSFDFAGAPGPNRVAADETVECLQSMGQLEAIDVAQVWAFVMLAEAVDADPSNASLWGQYRAAELQLRGVTDRGKESAFESLLKELADSSTGVPDATVAESSDKGNAGRKGVGGSRVAVDGAPAVDSRRRRGAAA